MKNLVGLALILILALSACAKSTAKAMPTPPTPIVENTTPQPTEPTSPIATLRALPPQSPLSTPKEPPPTIEHISPKTDLVNRAIADLAERLSLSTAEITLVSSQSDEFPADNFGCLNQLKPDSVSGKQPQPKNGVSPAFVIATEITLDVPSQATRYIYRGKGTQLVFCFEKGY